jgi:hypothetical protein
MEICQSIEPLTQGPIRLLLPFSRVIWIQGFTTKDLIDETMANFIKTSKREKRRNKEREKPSPSQKSKTHCVHDRQRNKSFH